MSLQMKFFMIPMRSMQEAEEELNRFLSSVRVVQLQREFVDQADNSFWSIAVEYLNGDPRTDGSAGGERRRGRLDYKEILSTEDFDLFVKLRDWRKQRATEEATPVYTIFTNDQLAALVQQKVSTKEGLLAIEGVGHARVEKYGEAVLRILADEDRIETPAVEQ
jgi:superfamily II DNA helicase RecQ